jgi:DNA gyrase subunit B
MDAEQLRETTMDPEKRTLRRITITDGARAEKIFELLMGNDVAPRRDFIGTNQIDLERIDL